VIRAWCCRPEARLAPGVGVDGVRSKKPGHRTRGRSRGLDACCSVFKDRAATARAANLTDPISTFAAPGASGGPCAGA
jgi:hypothetical protein